MTMNRFALLFLVLASAFARAQETQVAGPPASNSTNLQVNLYISYSLVSRGKPGFRGFRDSPPSYYLKKTDSFRLTSVEDSRQSPNLANYPSYWQKNEWKDATAWTTPSSGDETRQATGGWVENYSSPTSSSTANGDSSENSELNPAFELTRIMKGRGKLNSKEEWFDGSVASGSSRLEGSYNWKTSWTEDLIPTHTGSHKQTGSATRSNGYFFTSDFQSQGVYFSSFTGTASSSTRASTGAPTTSSSSPFSGSPENFIVVGATGYNPASDTVFGGGLPYRGGTPTHYEEWVTTTTLSDPYSSSAFVADTVNVLSKPPLIDSERRYFPPYAPAESRHFFNIAESYTGSFANYAPGQPYNLEEGVILAWMHLGPGGADTEIRQCNYWFESNRGTPRKFLIVEAFIPDSDPTQPTRKVIPWTAGGDSSSKMGSLANSDHIANFISSADGAAPGSGIFTVSLLPVEVAPDVLRVNADFDEQRLDSATHFAKGDNEDEDLKAASGPEAGKIIIQDLHKGFFGVHPNTLPADFYSGATVTIEKLPEIDSETSQPEVGEVRFYATKNQGASGEQFWLIAISDPAGGGGTTPKNLVPVLYGPNPTVPRGTDVQYWIEGIKAGPITLEFKYVKGTTTFNYKQKFLVETHQSKADWQEEIRQQILLQTKASGASGAVDMALYVPPWGPAPFMTNRVYIQNVYAYYEYLYLQKPNLFLWAGLAKMAGGPVYGAMVDAEYARTLSPMGLAVLASATADFFQETLTKGNYEIFDDLAWQFRAYQASGIWALRYVRLKDLDPGIRDIDLPYWEEMWQGEYSSSSTLVQKANYDLTNREQQYIVQGAWTEFKTHGVTGIQYLLNILAYSPIYDLPGVGALSFSDVVGPTKDITLFPDRWDWIDCSYGPYGIWDDWISLSTTTRTGFVTIPLSARAGKFRWFVWIGYPVIW